MRGLPYFMKKPAFTCILLFILSNLYGQLEWVHISSKTGAIEVPNAGKQQTSCAVADFDNDGDAPRLDIWLQNGTSKIISR